MSQEVNEYQDENETQNEIEPKEKDKTFRSLFKSHVQSSDLSKDFYLPSEPNEEINDIDTTNSKPLDFDDLKASIVIDDNQTLSEEKELPHINEQPNSIELTDDSEEVIKEPVIEKLKWEKAKPDVGIPASPLLNQDEKIIA